MSHADFVHLHTHSHYSVLQASAQIDDLLAAASKHAMPALALTDHANLFGAVEFYQKAKKKGVTPIIGCEIYVSEGSRFDEQKEDWHRLVLLVRDEKGFKNLIRLVSRSYTEGFFKKPRIDLPLLRESSEGLIALSSMLDGPIASRLLVGLADEAKHWAALYRDLFGRDATGEPNFYVEVQDHGLPNERMVGHRLVQVAQEVGVPLVLTNDVHYVRREEAVAHQCHLFIGQGRQLELAEGKEVDLELGSDQFYFKSPEEMKEVGRRFPGAYENTVRIARRCHLQLKFGVIQLPRFDLPQGVTADDYLLDLCRKAIPERYPDADPELSAKLEKRLEFEAATIKKMGYATYFLVVWDFIRKARELGIGVGPGRGSAAGSLIAYLTRITNICPIRYGLFFERFLNPERVSMPDVDIDFDDVRRGEVIDYVVDKYGRDCVSQIVTFGTLSAKSAIKDVARVLDIPFHVANDITKAIPDRIVTGFETTLDVTIDNALSESKDLRAWAERYPRLFEIARSLEGCCRQTGIHAAGVVIAPAPLETLAPMYVRDGEVTTQYDMAAIDAMGLLKMDFLGLSTLTVIKEALDHVEANRGLAIDIDAIPLDEIRTYHLLAAGDTLGVFQFESSGFRDLLRRVKPTVFEDLIALLALYRPGPLGSGMVEDFIETKHGRKAAEYPHEKLKGLLEETYGVMLYQEQVMACASILAGYSLGQADQLRRAMGKKKPEEMEKHKAIFLKESVARGIEEAKAAEIFGLMEKFAGYGFNKSHSAAYALVSYQTAFLKANFPTEYMAAVLTNESGDTDKLSVLFEECRRLAIPVKGPDANRSKKDFSVHGDEILFGLEAIKGMGEAAVEGILKARAAGPYRSLADFCSRVDLRVVNRRAIEALIKAGAFDFSGRPRSQLMAVVEHALQHGSSIQEFRSLGQGTLMDMLARQGAGSSGDDVDYPAIPEFPERDLLAFEKEALGFYLSGHPLHEHRALVELMAKGAVPEIAELPEDARFLVAGLVKEVRKRRTKSGADMAIVLLEDLRGSSELPVFSELLATAEKHLVEDEILLVSGRIVRRGEEKRVEVESVLPLGQLATADSWKVAVTIATDEEKLMAPQAVTRLRSALLANPGTRPLRLRVKVGNASALIRPGERFKVAPTRELVEAVQAVLGPGSLRLEVEPPAGPPRRGRAAAAAAAAGGEPAPG